MQDKGMDFRRKEVINITDATRLGYVQDVCADLETGKITSIIVPGGPNKLLNFFSSKIHSFILHNSTPFFILYYILHK